MRFFALVLASVLIVSPVLADEEKIVPRYKTDMNFSFAPVVKKTAPAVVNIYTKQKVTVMENASPLMNDPFFQQFFGRQGLSFGGRPREAVLSSLGSGVLVNPNGFIVTAHHVIKDAQEITVILSNKEEYAAKVLMKDPKADLAFLKIEAKEPLPFLEMRDSDALEVGDIVLAMGNPFGVGQTVTSGIVSALARKAAGVSDYQYFIQTDAAINPGNSGGALITTDGKLVGINTAIYSKSGGSQGIGFAIPSNIVRSLMESKIEGGRVVHPWFGAQVQTVTREIADSMGMKSAQGVIVRSVYPASPAEKGGLKVGDILLSLNGTTLSSPDDLQYRLVLAKIGATTTLKLLRGGDSKTVDVELIAPPENPKRDVRAIKGRHPLDGVTVANMSPALAVELGMDETIGGVVVLSAGASANGINIGWNKGDIVMEINGTKITSTAQLAKLMDEPGHSWKIIYRRGNHVDGITVQL